MNIPPVDSLWIDNDPRTTPARYVLVTGPPVDDKVQCLSWYDITGGAQDARPSKNNLKRFRPSSTGHWSKTGFRPAEKPPVLGYPYGYGPDAEQYTGSDDA